LRRIARLAPEEGELEVAVPAVSQIAEAPSTAAVQARSQVETALSEAAPEVEAIAAIAPMVQPPAEARAFTPPTAELKDEPEASAVSKREIATVPQSKSVRIALERLDRMMNAVGELVINRTRML